MANKLIEHIGTGRRKRAVASVRLRPGKGIVKINGRAFEDYFTLELQRKVVNAPLMKVGLEGQYDLVVRIKGGGIEAQAVATQLGVSRALVKEDENRRQDLKACGFLTRDPRKRERKKYGLAGARKRFQFSKR
ncbi:MAG: 30S ribosomal protein S9 [Waddliaceae bacterium]|jgi:small subunit ribosomal protein S9|nr:30S ribosomal protein S9 [Waddliaceae bacterium]MBT3579132.1 30S ribosomal protein S9 [Waddliaceae bacterium]MBT4444885.1 30S ribosomal protein S9 [Waddliaceae bacterium]MBT6927922.1 30S ribosomal protein S9 [Waddliaceae bacterium]MBT7264788.1 30S ribosomal protein S9 [Waddliaceae bacterium]